MSGTLIGYARCSTDRQDLTAQHDRLAELGVAEERIYLDHGLTGTNRQRPGDVPRREFLHLMQPPCFYWLRSVFQGCELVGIDGMQVRIHVHQSIPENVLD